MPQEIEKEINMEFAKSHRTKERNFRSAGPCDSQTQIFPSILLEQNCIHANLFNMVHTGIQALRHYLGATKLSQTKSFRLAQLRLG